MADGLFGRNGSTGESRRRPLAPIATLLDLYRVGGLFNARDLRTLAEALDDSEVVTALGVTAGEIDEIRRRADAANP